ncbi:MAG TPA: hypothetical protein VED45_08525 [Steroidobacteraceae bacterium]|nr:hypothetical protein [Steroidobacteraceae bacterium]
MSSTPPRPESAEPGRPSRLRRAYGALPPWVRRELIIYGSALLCGLLLMPLLIWFAGNRVLGPYTHGPNPHAGPFALLADFFASLVHGSAVFWVVALGPAGLLLLLRLFVRLVRVLPSAAATRGGRSGGPPKAPPGVTRPSTRLTSAGTATPPRRT